MRQLSVGDFVFNVIDGRVIQCAHESYVMTRRTIKGGAQQAVKQCLECFRTVGNPVPKASVANFSRLPEFKDLADEYCAAYSKAVQTLIQGDKEEWFKQHSEYLRSSEWAKKRRLVMLRARGLCEGCMEDRATQVHHLTYRHWREELLFELVAVCDACHEKAHSDRGAA